MYKLSRLLYVHGGCKGPEILSVKGSVVIHEKGAESRYSQGLGLGFCLSMTVWMISHNSGQPVLQKDISEHNMAA